MNFTTEYQIELGKKRQTHKIAFQEGKCVHDNRVAKQWTEKSM